jgi:cell division septum initiation protein DivIVA
LGGIFLDDRIMNEKDRLRAAIEQAKAKTSSKPADSLEQKLAAQIAQWKQTVEPAFRAAVKDANDLLTDAAVQLRIYRWPFKIVYVENEASELPGIAVAATEKTNRATQLASALAGAVEEPSFSGPYVEAHLDERGRVIVVGHNYAITRCGTFSLAQFSNELIKEIVFEFAKLVAVPMGF